MEDSCLIDAFRSIYLLRHCFRVYLEEHSFLLLRSWIVGLGLKGGVLIFIFVVMVWVLSSMVGGVDLKC